MGEQNSTKKRLDFLEGDEGGLANREKEPSQDDAKAISYPVMARYDFNGKGPRPGISLDNRLFQQAGLLKTAGEILSPTLIKMGWVFVRLAIGFAIIYLILRGNTFNCMGSEIHFW
jgi:hypothetical protein